MLGVCSSEKFVGNSFHKIQLALTSDYILNETLFLVWKKTKNLILLQHIDDDLQGSEKIKLLKVNEAHFTTAKSFKRKFSSPFQHYSLNIFSPYAR